MASIAQVAILVLIFPIVAIFLDGSTVINLIQGIPVFDTWVGVLYDRATFEAGNIILVYIKSFFEAITMGVFVHITKGVAKNVLHAKGLPIISTFIGIILGSCAVKYVGVVQGFEIIFYFVILIAGILMVVKGAFGSSNIMPFKTFLAIIVESITAVIMCGYISALALLSNGAISPTKVVVITAITIAALIVTYFTTGDKA